MDEQQIHKKAKRIVLAKKIFFAHLMIYLACVPVLFVINFMTSPDFWWFLFPVVGWGFMVVVHYIVNLFILGANNSDWEQKEMAKQIERIKISDNTVLELDSDLLDLREKEKLNPNWDERDLV